MAVLTDLSGKSFRLEAFILWRSLACFIYLLIQSFFFIFFFFYRTETQIIMCGVCVLSFDLGRKIFILGTGKGDLSGTFIVFYVYLLA